LLGLVGANHALGRPIAALTSTARRLGSGDLSARTGLRPRGGELQDLAASIDAMAAELEAQVAERDRAAAKLEVLANELTTRVHDRTAALEQALDEADRASRAKTAFLSRLSHELRTPLNAIRGFSQLLTSKELTPDQTEAAEHIAAGAEHMTLLVEELLDTARIETGEFRVELEPVALGSLLAETVAMSNGLATEHGVALLGPTVDPSVRVVADRSRLEQALLNVVKNAIVYNRNGGIVSLRVSRTTGPRVAIDVLDTGEGIASDALERVFLPYERLGRGVESDGLGLGLALSRRLVEAMGGDITVASEVGVGSRFTIELIEAEPGRGDPSRRAPAAPAAERRPPRRVLYIEDNATSMKLVELLLRGREIDFSGAATGAEGLAAARADRPDLILLDLQLPDQTGEDVLRALRAEPALRAVPIVMLSAQASRDTVRRLLEAGADDYLTKPLEVDRAADVIERLLHRRDG
jgi:signal transduction histidine kinase/ActR/RegA family two-component response regulator